MNYKNITLAGTMMALVLPLAVPMTVWAQDDGRHEGDTYWQSITAVNLSAEAHKKVAPDRVSADVINQQKASTAEEAQAKVNAAAQDLQALVDKAKGVKLVTSSYSVYETSQYWVTDENGKQVRNTKQEWQAQQGYTLDGTDAAVLQKLAGKLQEKGFLLQGINFYLSPDETEKVKNDLVEETVGKIKAQADKMAKLLGDSSVRFAHMDVNVGGGYSPVRPMMAMARMDGAMAKEAPAPVAAPDDVDVAVTVSAEVHLK